MALLKDINLLLEKSNYQEFDDYIKYDDEFYYDSSEEDDEDERSDDSDLSDSEIGEWTGIFEGIWDNFVPRTLGTTPPRPRPARSPALRTSHSLPIITRTKGKLDLRGRHTAEDRYRKKLAYLEHWRLAINHPPCVKCGNESRFTLDDDTCMSCGHCSRDPAIAGVPGFFDLLRIDGIYNPIFYFMERVGNWTAKCPPIPAEEFQLILRKLCKQIGDFKYFSHRAITRELIYAVVNKLYGRRKEDRKKLVFRERWVAIKLWMCQQEFFQIPDAAVFLQRFRTFRPSQRCLETLRQMLIHLEKRFVAQKRKTREPPSDVDPEPKGKKKPKSEHRHNRICRDIAVLMLLAGIYPPLVVIFGTDYWRPPRTTKSRKENEQRFHELLAIASAEHPNLPWPPLSLSLSTVLSWDRAEIRLDKTTLLQFDCLPLTLQSAIGDFSISRQLCTWI